MIASQLELPRCAVPGCTATVRTSAQFLCSDHWTKLPSYLMERYRKVVRNIPSGKATEADRVDVIRACLRSLTPTAKGGAA